MSLEAMPGLANLYASHGYFFRKDWGRHFEAFANVRSEAEDIPDELLLLLVEKELG